MLSSKIDTRKNRLYKQKKNHIFRWFMNISLNVGSFFYDDCSLFAFLYNNTTTIDSSCLFSFYFSVDKCSIWGDKKQLRRKIPVKQFKSEVLTISYGFTSFYFTCLLKNRFQSLQQLLTKAFSTCSCLSWHFHSWCSCVNFT